LCAPFLFNPVGFGSTKAVDDWKEWNKRIRQQGGLGIHQDKVGILDGMMNKLIFVIKFAEILLSLRFFIYQYGLVYHLDITQQSKNLLVISFHGL
jgi:callose synthase